MSSHALVDTALAVSVSAASAPLLSRFTANELFVVLLAFSAVLACCWRAVVWIKERSVEANATTFATILTRLDGIDRKLDAVAARTDEQSTRIAHIEGALSKGAS